MSGSFVDARDERGETALSCAVAGGHEECVRCLLHAGADALLVAGCELTALQLAVVRGHTAIARLLWEHTGAHLASAVRT